MNPFNIYLHHGGTFYRTTRSMSYIGGLVDMLNDVKPEEFSNVNISAYLKRYPGYRDQILKYWYIKPGEVLGKGRKALENEDDILIMCKIAQESQFINVYVEHVEEQDYMEKALKQVLIDSHSEEDEKKSETEFYHEDENEKNMEEENSDQTDDEVEVRFECDEEDKDFVIQGVEEYGFCDEGGDKRKGKLGQEKKKKKGKELASERVEETLVEIDENVDDDVMNGEHGNECDVRDTMFSVGMEFESIYDFKQAVSRLSRSKKRELKFKAHSTDRASGFCAVKGCPWRVYASIRKKRGKLSKLQVRGYKHVHTCVDQVETPRKAEPKASRPNERHPRGCCPKGSSEFLGAYFNPIN